MSDPQTVYDTAALFAAVAERIRKEMLEKVSSESDEEFHAQTSNILFEGLGHIKEPIVLTYTVDDGTRKLVFEFRVELQSADSNAASE